MRLREATDADLMFFYHLRNDRQTCLMSRRPPVTLEEHTRWWHQTMDVRLVAEEGYDIGTLRLGTLRVGADGVVSIVVHPQYRGRGLGTDMLRALVPFARTRGFKRLLAEIAPENMASQRAFAKAGWSPILYEVSCG